MGTLPRFWRLIYGDVSPAMPGAYSGPISFRGSPNNSPLSWVFAPAFRAPYSSIFRAPYLCYFLPAPLRLSCTLWKVSRTSSFHRRQGAVTDFSGLLETLLDIEPSTRKLQPYTSATAFSPVFRFAPPAIACLAQLVISESATSTRRAAPQRTIQ